MNDVPIEPMTPDEKFKFATAQGEGSWGLLLLAVIGPYVWFETWVLTTLWNWHIVEAFRLPPIAKPTAFGLVLLFMFFFPNVRDTEKTSSREFVTRRMRNRVFLFAACLLIDGFLRR
jgi:hypothetical protein